MTDLQDRIGALPPEKRQLLERRLADLLATRAPAAGDRIRPRDRSRPIPLGIQQEQEWAIGRFRSANNVTGAFRVEGEFDLAVLSDVFTEVIARHEVLRSTIEPQADGTPVQVVHPVTPLPTPVVDLSDLPPRQQREEVRRNWQAEVARPFEPAEPRRLRITLLRLAATTHVAVFVADHAAADAWSLTILVQEIAALYGLHGQDGDRSLPPPELQFGDFAAWQREQFGESRMATELEYWRQSLADMPAELALPADRPYPARPTFAGDEHVVMLPPELVADLRDFSARENASLLAVLLAACSVLLQRHTGQDDLVIGSLVAGRDRVETEQLIGCFANPVPLRMQLADDQTLRYVVSRARDAMAAAYEHQNLPFDRLIQELSLGRESARTSLSRVWLNVLTVLDSSLELPGLRITPETIDLGQTSVDITLSALPRADTLELRWQYMTELFDAESVARFAGQFQEILHQLVTAPATTVGQVQFAAPAVPTAMAAAAAPGDGASFVELFQRRVALAPHAPAVICDGAPTSYAELNRAANRLARRLRAHGVGQETRVGVLVDRSPELAVAILGVLKAGGAYVPVDRAFPPDRIAFMLSDAGVQVLVSQEQLADGLAAAGHRPLYEVVLLDEQPGDDDDHDLPALPDPASLAYVVYTSGSTGLPKGAMIEHRSLVTFARDIVDRLGLGAGDRFLQFASPSFDVLAEELFPTWLAGGALVITTRHLISGEADLAELAERERVTVMELPTAYWHEWVRELHRQDRTLPSCLRLVIIGGERVLPDRLAMWRRFGIPLMHVYGLTETTVSSTFFRLDPADPARDWPNLPIGIPLPSADLRILDGQLRPMPAGGIAELYIGGVSVARGYLGRAGLTAQRFTADPDPARPGQRLYRTGDLVRQRPDGNLEFISRADTQIKIRGFRVEPLEIESALSKHAQVAESVVALHEPAPGDRRLVAYVVPRAGGMPRTAELRQFLERELPAYMVPSAFVELVALPLSPNGKVDRDRLPAPDGSRPELSAEYVAPQSPVQEKLASIVAAVVGLAKIGIYDNFFEVGGDSILAIQVVARAQEEGIRLSPYDLFVHPSVASLAEVATTGVTVDAEQGDVTGPVPLAPMQGWFCTAGIAEPHHWNTSVALDLAVPADLRLIREAVEHLLAHHDGLRQRFLLAGDRTRVRIAPRGDATPFEVHDLSGCDEAEQSRRLPEIVARLQVSLDLAVGPLLRAALIRRGELGPDRLAVVVHRLVADAVSMRILLEDLHTALAQLSAGEPVRLPAKTTSWQAWARRLAAYAQTSQVQSERGYWSDVAGAPAGRLPLDKAAGNEANTVASARAVSASLSYEETGELLHAVPGALDCRVDELLLAVLGRTLRGWSGHARHLVDLERHHREQTFEDVDLTRTVGWFSRIYPVALACDPGSSPVGTLKAVKEALRTVPSGGIGWQLLHQDRDPVPSSPSELVFSYLGQLDQAGSRFFTAVPGSLGSDQSPRGRRPYAIEVQASVADGKLIVCWRYSESLHDAETVRHLADCYLGELRAMLELGRSTADSAHSPSDFPLARVSQAQLDELLRRL